ncbi:MAG: hypothetical protein OXB96_02990 [Candidatus Kaiserbacteria bacterium]|nr:hypothetical protein [Candidatus Kaiserbacteria bacterium]
MMNERGHRQNSHYKHAERAYKDKVAKRDEVYAQEVVSKVRTREEGVVAIQEVERYTEGADAKRFFREVAYAALDKRFPHITPLDDVGDASQKKAA